MSSTATTANTTDARRAATATSAVAATLPVAVDCAVCCESFVPMPKQPPMTCGHNDVCRACHTKYLNTRTPDELVGGIKCMFKNCAEKYTAAILPSLVGAPAAAALQSRIDERTFLAQPFAMLCPRAGCIGRVIGPAPDNAQRSTICPACAMIFCADCHADAHDGQTCDAAAAQRANGDVVTTEQFINGVTKRCPQCLFRVWKNGGCPHMVCTRCKFNFCFGCLKARASHSAISEHPQCAALSAQFEAAAEQRVRGWKQAAKAAQRRAAAAAIAARQQARIGTRVRGADVETVVIASFFDDDLFVAAAPGVVTATPTPVETTSTVATVTPTTVETTSTVATVTPVETTSTVVTVTPTTVETTSTAASTGLMATFMDAPVRLLERAKRRVLAMSF